MNKLIITIIALFALPQAIGAQITLDYCMDKAETNYPLVKRYALVEKTTDLQLSDINKGWLPKIGVYGQATVQNVVPGFPETLKNAVAQMGQDMKGLSRLQYKAGIDVNQTIWDGETSKSQREIERASEAVANASLDVQMYAVKERVMNLFFGILLMDQQIAQTENTVTLLKADRRMLESMLSNGVAMQSDVDMVEAQELTLMQQLKNARSAVSGYRDMLAIYIGESLYGKSLVTPEAIMPPQLEPARPELSLFDAQQRLNAARNSAVTSTLMPRVGFFAQAYYGYPGLNYFESMVNRDLSFNVVAGVKLSWNIDSYYTRKNARRRLTVSDEEINADRDVFLFNNRLQSRAQTSEIDGLRSVTVDDEKIVRLRSRVREAAESQLKNGEIDATALLSKITDENQARLTASYHEIQLIQSIYKLKNTLNR